MLLFSVKVETEHKKQLFYHRNRHKYGRNIKKRCYDHIKKTARKAHLLAKMQPLLVEHQKDYP